MGVGRARFTVCTEVGVVTDSALVTDTSNIRRGARARGAERAIAADTVMDRHGSEEAGATGADIGERFVDRNKSMLGMHEACVGNAIRTVVPVGAVQALVADTADEL
jgi:hypothetical protein